MLFEYVGSIHTLVRQQVYTKTTERIFPETLKGVGSLP